MKHTYKNIVKETKGLIPYATWDLAGDYFQEITELLDQANSFHDIVSIDPKNFKVLYDNEGRVGGEYSTVISLAANSDGNARPMFEMIDNFAESLPHRVYTTFWNHGNELRNKIPKKKESLVDKL